MMPAVMAENASVITPMEKEAAVKVTGKEATVGSPRKGLFSPLLNSPSTVVSTGKQVAVEACEIEQMSPAFKTTTGSVAVAGRQGAKNTMKLAAPVKVVQVPVAGQPGQYVTGLLPVVPPVTDDEAEEKKALKPRVKIAGVVLAILLVLLGVVGAIWIVRTHTGASTRLPATTHTTIATATPDLQATVASQLTATAQANIILSDPLSQNIHNWLTSPPDVYAFKDGAYHITDRGNSGRATVLQGRTFAGPLGYTLTMEEITGDDTSASNSFGMIFRFSQQTKNGKTVTTFYSFEMVNMKGGEYQFWKYDDSQSNSPWTEIWHQPFGSEFHQGHGPQSVNTVKVFANGKNFTFTVNGKLIKTVQDSSLASGTIGMIVNYNGTEVAFTNLLLTHN
jgi:hypothetical protein